MDKKAAAETLNVYVNEQQPSYVLLGDLGIGEKAVFKAMAAALQPHQGDVGIDERKRTATEGIPAEQASDVIVANAFAAAYPCP